MTAEDNHCPICQELMYGNTISIGCTVPCGKDLCGKLEIINNKY